MSEAQPSANRTSPQPAPKLPHGRQKVPWRGVIEPEFLRRVHLGSAKPTAGREARALVEWMVENGIKSDGPKGCTPSPMQSEGVWRVARAALRTTKRSS